MGNAAYNSERYRASSSLYPLQAGYKRCEDKKKPDEVLRFARLTASGFQRALTLSGRAINAAKEEARRRDIALQEKHRRASGSNYPLRASYKRPENQGG